MKGVRTTKSLLGQGSVTLNHGDPASSEQATYQHTKVNDLDRG